MCTIFLKVLYNIDSFFIFLLKLMLHKYAMCTLTYRWNSLHLASQNGHSDVAQALIDNEIEVDAVTDDGCTALMLASQQRHMPCVEMLLKSGAYINHKAPKGYV